MNRSGSPEIKPPAPSFARRPRPRPPPDYSLPANLHPRDSVPLRRPLLHLRYPPPLARRGPRADVPQLRYLRLDLPRPRPPDSRPPPPLERVLPRRNRAPRLPFRPRLPPRAPPPPRP